MPETTTEKRGQYEFAEIERKWQSFWRTHKTFKVANPGDPGFDASRPKRYILDMFPYPSGAGLHVGHPLGYTATDIYARYSRMQGYNVLHPMGYDAFGLPAEQYAIETGVHPAETTRKNIENMRRQLQMFGFSYDWDRELSTCQPDYYHWTQWIFLQLFNHWFDECAEWTDPNGRPTRGRARPVSELIEQWESNTWSVDDALNPVRQPAASPNRAWTDLSAHEQRTAVDRMRLAFMDEVPVNWCPALGTVLANEEVTNEGRSDRGNHPVFRRPLKQWMLRITAYAPRLLADLELVGWPEPIKLMQRNWIGQSTGAEVDFPIVAGGPKAPIVADVDAWRRQRESTRFPGKPDDNVIRIYTTRPDTLYGATYMVLAPEHALVDPITTPDRKAAVTAYVRAAATRSELDRTADTREKTGEFTGAFALNPVNGSRIPIWVADYVLMGYGTGAIMAVPASDVRDFDFARRFELPITPVVAPTPEWLDAHRRKTDPATFDAQYRKARDAEFFALVDEAYTEPGTGINSGNYDGLSTAEFKERIIADLERDGVGKGAVKFKLRDWIFTRQRYWGEPFPILHAPDGRVVALPESELPLTLPPVEDYKPTVSDTDEKLPEPPLGRATEWRNVDVNGERFERDLNTMPQWAGSCWYYLRFTDPTNSKRFCDPEAERYWMPVDTYVGGAEHAVLHLLYARFWHKVLFDLGHVSTAEPFRNLTNQGMIQSFAYEDDRGINIPMDQVEESETGTFTDRKTGQPVAQRIAKMSKGLKNVVNPDDIIGEFGADTFRCYEMFMGPLEAAKPWNSRDVPGIFRLLSRIWRLVIDTDSGEISSAVTDDPPDTDALRILHKTIKKVGDDIEAFRFNTAIGQIFEFVNALTPMEQRSKAVLEPFILLVAPFAPHLAEELWARLGHTESLANAPWPAYDEKLARDEAVEIAVQILGKTKAKIMIAADADEAAIESAALADPKVQAAVAGKTVRKVIVVKGRLVNIVAN